jgi:hypothetical protein
MMSIDDGEEVDEDDDDCEDDDDDEDDSDGNNNDDDDDDNNEDAEDEDDHDGIQLSRLQHMVNLKLSSTGNIRIRQKGVNTERNIIGGT